MIQLNLDQRSAQRVQQGYPWVFRSDTTNPRELDTSETAVLCTFADQHNRVIATGYANPKTQLMGRVLSSGTVKIDQIFFENKFRAALAWRQQCFNGQDFYRLVHSESDGLPGLVIDRFGDTLVVQVNTAGMEMLHDLWFPALQKIVEVKNIVFKNDGNTRNLEGMTDSVNVIQGTVPEDGRVELIENNARFYADVLNGQKTGWFYDQRPHRAWVANLSKGKSVIDVFCHTGGFGITAGINGASDVTFVDSSFPAIEITKANAELNGLTDKSTFIVGKAFETLEKINTRYDVVSVDPPAFVKTKKDLATGLKGYEKLAKLAAPLVNKGGVLFYASCSSHPTEKDIIDAVILGCAKAKRQACLVYVGTAGPDHPTHPQLPETRYLKALGFRLT
jgi:23S rRNA (cytosine1962-C5)-methyltransferase